MAEKKELDEQELNAVAGGTGGNGQVVRVCNLQKGYLALRQKPYYDPSNEIRGSESYNGDELQITGSYVKGADGFTYVWVFNPRSGCSGYVNAAYVQ